MSLYRLPAKHRNASTLLDISSGCTDVHRERRDYGWAQKSRSQLQVGSVDIRDELVLVKQRHCHFPSHASRGRSSLSNIGCVLLFRERLA
jgi:hypothetical protein